METDSLTPDAEEQSLRELGQETDRNQGRPIEPPAETPEAAVERPVSPEEAPQPDAPAPEAPETPPEPQEVPEPKRDAPQQRPRDPVTGKFLKPEEGKPETEYSKAQKEEIRKDRTWRSIQAEKEQIRAERLQWEEQQRMQQLEATRETFRPLKRDGLTAQEYFEGAKVFEKEGDYENALKAHRVAQEMFQQEQGRFQQMQGVEAEYQWRQQMAEVAKAAPEIMNADSPMSKYLAGIIERNPWLYNVPQGFYRAAEFAHMLTQVTQMKEKDDEIVALKAELEKHQRKGQPARGGYATPRTGDKDFEEMDLKEMEAHLKGITSEADNWR